MAELAWDGVEGGHQVLKEVAPDAVALMDRVAGGAWQVVDARLLAPAAAVCANQHDLTPVASPSGMPVAGDVRRWRTDEAYGPGDRIVLDFAQQFAVDVSRVSDEQREALAGELGDATFAFVQALYQVDFQPRVRAVADALFGPSEWPPPDNTGDVTDLWPVIEQVIVAIAKLDRIDPLTTEFVRMRGARQHNCRVCQSMRNKRALAAWHDDDFRAIDDYASSELDERQRAALALTDALIWTPGRVDPSVLADVRQHFTPAEAAEIVLDVYRNGTNKIPVSLNTDQAFVTEGYALYDIAPSGDLVYG